MSEVERLFLGGPLHGQRLQVQHDDSSWTALRPWAVAGYFRTADDPPVDDWSDRVVVYVLRRISGTEERVFIAPDFGYDTPEWLAYDTVAWVGEKVPDVVGWEHLGPWRWRGRMPEDARWAQGYQWLYVLLDGRGEGSVKTPVTDEMVDGDPLAADYLFREMQHEIDYHYLPMCVVPGCTEKAPAVFWADEAGRLAGRAWRKGDEIRLCPPHGVDLYHAAGARGVEEMAEWLRPDARVYDNDLWTRLAAHHWGEDSQTRALRVSIPMKETG